MSRLARLAFVVLAVGACRVHHVRDADEEEDWHPIDHFTTHAAFRATFHRGAPAEDEATWPAPGASVGLTELTCIVRESTTGRTAKCSLGENVPPAFRALRTRDQPPLGSELKKRLGQCYAVTAHPWTSDQLRAYERELVANPAATPSAGDEWVLAYVGHDGAPFLKACTREPDGTCVYQSGTGEVEGELEERLARAGKRASPPYAPEERKLVLSFADGHMPPVFYGTRIVVNDGSSDRDLRAANTVDWQPIVAWYQANDPRSPNYPIVLALAGRLEQARALGGIPEIEPSFVTTDPCPRSNP